MNIQKRNKGKSLSKAVDNYVVLDIEIISENIFYEFIEF